MDIFEQREQEQIKEATEIIKGLSEDVAKLMLIEVARKDSRLVMHIYNRIANGSVIDMEISLMASSGDKLVPCVKRYRELTGASLRTSLLHVKSLYNFG